MAAVGEDRRASQPATGGASSDLRPMDGSTTVRRTFADEAVLVTPDGKHRDVIGLRGAGGMGFDGHKNRRNRVFD